MRKDIKHIGIIGSGGWGTALAALLSKNNHRVVLWSYEQKVVDEINSNHTNSIYLKGITLPSNIRATSDPCEFRNFEIIVATVPTQYIRSTFSKAQFNLKNSIIVNGAKGVERNTLLRPSQIFTEVTGLDMENYVVLTGPSHAEEVSRGTPTTVVAASDNILNAKIVQENFSNNEFRVYTSDDVVGCEIGGALKNVIALAAGIIDGLELGDNTKAAVITRGLAEMSRLGLALGGKQMTLSGLSGLGDLVVTCNSLHSRNRYVGEQIGKGRAVSDIINNMQMVAEGISTTESAYFLSLKHSVDMPITEQMYNIIFKGVHPLEAIKSLMTRQSKHEWWW